MAILYAQATYEPSTRAIVRDTTIGTAPSDYDHALFSVSDCPSDVFTYVVAMVVESGGFQAIRVDRRQPALLVTSITHTAPSFPILSVAVTCVSGASPSFLTFLSYSEETDEDGSTWVCAFHAPTYAVRFTRKLVDDRSWRFVDNVYTPEDGGTARIYTSGICATGGAAGTQVLYRPATASGGVFNQPVYQASAGRPAGRAFTWQGKAYLPVVLLEGGQAVSGVLVHLCETDGIGGFVAPVVGSWSVGSYGTFGSRALPFLNAPARFTNSRGLESFAYITPSLAGVRQTQLDRVVISGQSGGLALPPTQAQGLAVLPGALTSFFDGERVFEAGFLARPKLGVEDVTSTPDDGLADGRYLYTAMWEHFDAKGLVHYSQAAQVLTVDVALDNPDADAQVSLRIDMDRYTRRGDRDDTRDNAARLVVYRTKSNGSLFYRLMTPTSINQAALYEPSGPVENDPSVAYIYFDDTVSDDQLDALGYGFYPFNLGGAVPGAPQEGGPPPPSRFVLNTKQRVFGISGDDPRRIFFSRFFVAGEAPAFPPAFSIYLSDQDEACTALAALGDKLLIFTKTRIYYVFGDGPNDAGTAGFFPEPVLFSDSLGCEEPRSVITTPQGVMFYAGDGGIYLVDQSLQANRVSGAVEDTLALINAGDTSVKGEVRGVHLDTARGWVVWALVNGTIGQRPLFFLVYSYWTGQWVKWTRAGDPDGPHPTSTCLWQGKHVYGLRYAPDFGPVAIETPGEHRDRVRNESFGGGLGWQASWRTIHVTLQTPWIRLGALNGFQRVRRVQFLGYSKSPDGDEEIEVSLDHDGETGAPQATYFNINNIHGFPVVRLGMHVARQKCSSVRITVTMAHFGGYEGAIAQALTLEIAGLPGMAKLSKKNKGVA